MSKSALIQARSLGKSFVQGNTAVRVLADVNLNVMPGETWGIVGRSGSGKSTLLHLLGGLDRPSLGQVLIAGQDWQSLDVKTQARLRNQYLGFVYQFHHLLPEFSALENVAMPLWIARTDEKLSLKRAQEVLVQVGLPHRLHHHPSELSGGERQRVAIARALVHEPKVLLADEPTGNLDSQTGAVVFKLLQDLVQRLGSTLIMVTHDERLAAQCGHQFRLDS